MNMLFLRNKIMNAGHYDRKSWNIRKSHLLLPLSLQSLPSTREVSALSRGAALLTWDAAVCLDLFQGNKETVFNQHVLNHWWEESLPNLNWFCWDGVEMWGVATVIPGYLWVPLCMAHSAEQNSWADPAVSSASGTTRVHWATAVGIVFSCC